MRAQEQGTTAAANQSTPDGPASCGVIEQDSLLSFVASASSQEHTFHLHASPCSPPAARLSGPWLHPPRLGRSVRRRTGDQTGANQCQPVPLPSGCSFAGSRRCMHTFSTRGLYVDAVHPISSGQPSNTRPLPMALRRRNNWQASSPSPAPSTFRQRRRQAFPSTCIHGARFPWVPEHRHLYTISPPAPFSTAGLYPATSYGY